MAVSGLEKHNPRALRSMVRQSDDGNPSHVDVRFYIKDPPDGPLRPVWITVTKNLAKNIHGNPAGASDTRLPDGTQEIAPALIEKAYVELNQQYHVHSETGGYRGVEGGNSNKAMTLLTGMPASAIPMDDPGAGDALEQVRQGKLVSLESKCSPFSNAVLLGPNIVSNHAYTVLGTSIDKDGQEQVTLRNPWGVDVDKNLQVIPGSDGIFTVAKKDLAKYFYHLDVGTASPDESQTG